MDLQQFSSQVQGFLESLQDPNLPDNNEGFLDLLTEGLRLSGFGNPAPSMRTLGMAEDRLQIRKNCLIRVLTGVEVLPRSDQIYTLAKLCRIFYSCPEVQEAARIAVDQGVSPDWTGRSWVFFSIPMGRESFLSSTEISSFVRSLIREACLIWLGARIDNGTIELAGLFDFCQVAYRYHRSYITRIYYGDDVPINPTQNFWEDGYVEMYSAEYIDGKSDMLLASLAYPQLQSPFKGPAPTIYERLLWQLAGDP